MCPLLKHFRPFPVSPDALVIFLGEKDYKTSVKVEIACPKNCWPPTSASYAHYFEAIDETEYRPIKVYFPDAHLL